MKTIEDFKKAAKEKNITKWLIHDCSMCDYPCGFLIENTNVRYDSGCWCVYQPSRESTWEDLSKHYNDQIEWRDNPRNERKELTQKAIDEYDKFWGFK